MGEIKRGIRSKVTMGFLRLQSMIKTSLGTHKCRKKRLRSCIRKRIKIIMLSICRIGADNSNLRRNVAYRMKITRFGLKKEATLKMNSSMTVASFSRKTTRKYRTSSIIPKF